MKLSVVIPTYNRRDLIARTLPTVLAQDFPSDEYEVVVVVDGSTDGTAEYLRGIRSPVAMRVLGQPNRGPAAARNAGIAAARGEIVLFLDDDIRCDPSLVRKHLAAHQGADSCIVFGPSLIAPESLPGLATEVVRASYDADRDRMTSEGSPRSEYDVWVTSNSSAPRALLLAHGGYDESVRLTIYEDAELAIRLWKAGVRFRFEPEAAVCEIYSKSASYLVETDAPQMGVNGLRLCRKHPGFRPHSLLARMFRGSRARSSLGWLCCAAPISPELALRAPFWIAERMRKVPMLRRAGTRLLNYRIGIAALRGAAREMGSWQALRREFGLKLPVLLYHHVGPRRPETNAELMASPEQFERQVRWLAEHGYVGIRPSDWLKWCNEGGPLPDRPVLITFDDGYADVAEYALPVLRRYGFSAAVYVVTGQIGGTNTWDRAKGLGPCRLMTADEIRHWAVEGIEFGAHSRTHPNLTTLEGDRLAEEIEGSRDDLARLLGTPPISFAYPHGAYTEPVRARVEQAFGMALSCDEGMNGLATDSHLLRRAEVRPTDSMFDFACRLHFGWLPAPHLRHLLRLRTRAKASIRRFGELL